MDKLNSLLRCFFKIMNKIIYQYLFCKVICKVKQSIDICCELGWLSLIIYYNRKIIWIRCHHSRIGDMLTLSPAVRKMKDSGKKVYCLCRKPNDKILKRMQCFDQCVGVTYYEQVEKMMSANKSIRMYSLNYGNEVFEEKNQKYIIDCIADRLGVAPLTDNRIFYELKKRDEKIAKKLLIIFKEYLLFCTLSGEFTYKRDWPAYYWQRLIDMQTMKVIIIGRQIANKNNVQYNNALDLRGKTTVHQMAALIKYSKLVVTVVSGPLWFANAYGKRAVVIQGGFEPEILTKYSNSYHITSVCECAPCLDYKNNCENNIKCMKSISPEMVHEKIKTHLDVS